MICRLIVLFCLQLSLASVGASDNLPDMGNTADTLLSLEEEKRLGKEFMRNIRRSLKLIEDPTSNEYIKSLGDKLLSHTDSRQQEFTFFIVDNPTINAFAGPGGYIGIHTGLILATRTEGELASVMAHEIAHITQRHLVRSVDKTQNMSMAAMAAVFAAILLGSSNSEVSEAVIASAVAGSAQNQLSFSRIHEQEADRVGIDMLIQAGFNPIHMANFFETMSQQTRLGNHSIPEFLLTHPVTSSRIADSRGRALNHIHNPDPSYDPLYYELIRSRLAVLTNSKSDSNPSVQIDEEDEDEIDDTINFVSLYYQAQRNLAQEKFSSAKAIMRKLIQTDRNRIPYLITLAEIDIAAQNYSEALKSLAQGLMLYPNNSPLTQLYGRTLLQAGHAKNAMQVVRNHLFKVSPSADLYKLLAESAEKAGFLSEAYEALAKYFSINGETKIAIEHLEQALNQKDTDEYRALKIKAEIAALRKTLPPHVQSSNSTKL